VSNIVVAINEAKKHFAAMISETFLNIRIVKISSVSIDEVALDATCRCKMM